VQECAPAAAAAAEQCCCDSLVRLEGLVDVVKVAQVALHLHSMSCVDYPRRALRSAAPDVNRRMIDAEHESGRTLMSVILSALSPASFFIRS